MKVVRVYCGETDMIKWKMILSYLRGLGVKFTVDEDKE